MENKDSFLIVEKRRTLLLLISSDFVLRTEVVKVLLELGDWKFYYIGGYTRTVVDCNWKSFVEFNKCSPREVLEPSLTDNLRILCGTYFDKLRI